MIDYTMHGGFNATVIYENNVSLESKYALINHTHNASAITAGVFDVARIPNLSISKITGVSTVGTTAASTISITTSVSDASTNAQIPTALAVYNALALAPGISTVTTTGSGNGVTAVDYNSTSHTLTVTKGSTFSLSGHTHTKSQITDFPTSMPASDVYAWAKEATKPAYTAAEVGALPNTTSFLKSISKSGNTYTVTNSANGTTTWTIPTVPAKAEASTSSTDVAAYNHTHTGSATASTNSISVVQGNYSNGVLTLTAVTASAATHTHSVSVDATSTPSTSVASTAHTHSLS